MGFVSQIPKINNLQFVPESVTLGTGYNRLPNDKDWYKNNIRKWQFGRPYKQKLEQADKQYIYATREDTNDMYFQVYDCNGNLVDLPVAYTDDKVVSDFQIYDSGASYVDQEGNETALTVHMWSFRFSDFNLDDGTYYLRMVVEFYDGMSLVETKYWISEPIDLRTSHPETRLLQCFDNSNRKIIFNYNTQSPTGWAGTPVKPVFGYRLECDIVDYGVSSNDNIFVEQDYEDRNLKPTAWDTKVLQIGGEHGVPQYLTSKMNVALTCDNIRIDGRRITKTDGAEWSFNDTKTNTLYAGEIDVRDYSEEDAITDNRGQKILIYDEPSFPYFIVSAGLSFWGNFIQGEYIVDSSARTTLVSDLNTTYADLYDLNGTFTYESGGVYYECAAGETYSSVTSILRDTPLDIDITINNNNDEFEFTIINNVRDYKGGVVWGDGTNHNIFALASSGTSKQFSNEYASSGSYTVRIFGDPTAYGISMLRQNHDAQIDDISGDLPASTVQFTMLCNSADFSGLGSGLDLSFIANAKTNISQLSIVDSGLDAFDGTVFADNPATGVTGNSTYWAQLNGISFYNNELTSGEVEAFIEDFYDFTPKAITGSIELRQDPAAPVTNTPATTYKTNLINAGWIVQTD